VPFCKMHRRGPVEMRNMIPISRHAMNAKQFKFCNRYAVDEYRGRRRGEIG
jgi:hypothetical protein